MNVEDIRTLACPRCYSRLSYRGTRGKSGHLKEGEIECDGCAWTWRVTDGFPYLYDEEEVRGLDRVMRFVYDYFGCLHDPAVRYLLPILQLEAASRDAYMRRLELEKLRRSNSRPLRILEVGIGDGANLPLIERHLPENADVEIWGVDLSRGMLETCRRRLARHRRWGRDVRLMLADAHALPFPAAAFDRVFHVGGIAAYHDPRKGLAEMARVAIPGTPIVVVDERLDPNRAHGLYQHLMFRAITPYDPAPAAPVSKLPPGAVDIIDEQASRFYYCLTFRMPRPKAKQRGRQRRR